MPMNEVVEESLKADARFRHLTVMPAVWTKEMLDRTEREADALFSSIKFETCPSWHEVHGDRK